MTTEEKAKAYDEALKKTRIYRDNARIAEDYVAVARYENIFPELRESEDEKTRKRLIKFISDVKRISESGRNSWAVRKDDAEMCNTFLSYLEKQKEQKPSIFPPGLGEVHWNPIPSGKDVHKWNLPDDFEEAVYKVANFISPFNSQEELRKVSHRFAEQLLDIAKKDEQKPAWSEEDEVYLQDALWCVNQAAKMARGENDMGACWSAERWLKSLRPVKQEWSEEDKEILEKLHRLLVICRGEKKFIQEADYNKMDNLLKSLRPQPHWKPSKEQQK